MIDTVRWKSDSPGKLMPGKLRLIDQTRLPEQLVYIETDEAEVIFNCIKKLVVRGAPAIGCAAALGLSAVLQHSSARTKQEFVDDMKKTADYFAKSRPTAVNLFWALNRCLKKIDATEDSDIFLLKELLIQESINILNEDIHMCRSIGENGIELIKDGYGILTHCNAGALATGDYGTALSPIYLAAERQMNITVYSDETRPLLQGSRLTAWELNKANISVITICDSMAAQVMREGKINLVIVGADRIAANGDSANKIGTYGLAILAKYHAIPFYIAAPHSTIDISLKAGDEIPIEQRGADEVRCGFGKLTAPANVNVYNPAFDVTPHELITGIITESRILRPSYTKTIKNFIKDQKEY
jgi:methylthioribose-1-phosphate isomerase